MTRPADEVDWFCMDEDNESLTQSLIPGKKTPGWSRMYVADTPRVLEMEGTKCPDITIDTF